MILLTAIYVRQSVDKRDSVSIDTQIELCKVKCDDIFQIYCDRGFSGRNLRRPGYTQMADDIRNGVIERVIVYRLDRLSRSVADFSRIWELFDKNNVTFLSVSEMFDTGSPSGRAMIYIIMTFAQMERETIAERIADNYRARIRCGAWAGGPVPFGFRAARMTEEEMRSVRTHFVRSEDSSHFSSGGSVAVLEPDKNAGLVRRIFRRYADGDISLSRLSEEINKHLNGSYSEFLQSAGPEESCAADCDNTHISRRFCSSALSRMLRNPIYVNADADVYEYYLKTGIGQICDDISVFDGSCSAQLTGRRAGGRTSAVPPARQTLSLTCFPGLIDSAVWLACQRRLSSNRAAARSPACTHTWLTGLLRCSRCGYSIIAKKTAGRIYLCCSGRYNRHICTVRSVRLQPDVLETQVQHALHQRLRTPPAHAAAHSRIPASSPAATFPGGIPDLHSRAVDNLCERRRLQNEINELISAFPRASATTADYIEMRIRSLQDKIISLSAAPYKKTAEEAAATSAPFDPENFSKLSNRQKNRLASVYIDHIDISDDGFEIVWKSL